MGQGLQAALDARLAVSNPLNTLLVSAKLAISERFRVLCHSGVRLLKKNECGLCIRCRERFSMKSVGLSETFHGLLDMEFMHLYKPELKLWRGSDPYFGRWVKECGWTGMVLFAPVRPYNSNRSAVWIFAGT